MGESVASVMAKARAGRLRDVKGRPVAPETFSWLMRTGAKYASWELLSDAHEDPNDAWKMRGTLWLIEKSGAYRD